MWYTIPQQLVALDYHGIILEWGHAVPQDGAELAGYRIYMKVDGGEEKLLTPTLIKKNQYMMPTYDAGSQYKFTIEAVDTEGNFERRILYFPS